MTLPEEVRQYLSALGKKGGASTSPAKRAASKRNGKRGGWPKGRKRKPAIPPAGLEEGR